MVFISSYVESIREDKYLWALILTKWFVAGLFVVSLVTLRDNLNGMGCRYAVETAFEKTSEAIGGFSP